VDVCPADAISDCVVDNDKCVLCLDCVKSCPNSAIEEADFKATIKKSPIDITGSIVSCLNCGLCVLNSNGTSLKFEDNKLRFDPASYNEGYLDESILKCPVSTLKEVASNGNINGTIESNSSTIEGYCVSCGKCVRSCDIQEARAFEKVVWDGKASDECVSCGTCVEFCPTDAIVLKGGTIEVNLEKCILCETCSIRCPKYAIPKSTMAHMSIFNGFNMVDKKLCINCKLCYKICPEDAIIDHGEDGVEVDIDKCIFCGACWNACPAKAFIFERDFIQTF